MATASDYILSLLLRKSRPNYGQFNCTLWFGATDSSKMYGRQKVRWPGSDVLKIDRVHRLSYMAHNNLTPDTMPTADKEGIKLEISHLCSNSLCINIAHLTLEKHSINQERIHCKLQNYCSECHSPKCII